MVSLFVRGLERSDDVVKLLALTNFAACKRVSLEWTPSSADATGGDAVRFLLAFCLSNIVAIFCHEQFAAEREVDGPAENKEILFLIFGIPIPYVNTNVYFSIFSLNNNMCVSVCEC